MTYWLQAGSCCSDLLATKAARAVMRSLSLTTVFAALPLIFMSSTHLSANGASAGASRFILYVGSYGKGVDAYRFDSSTGKLEPLGLVGEVTNPSFVITSADNTHLYAVSEVEGHHNGSVAAFAIDRHTGILKHLNSEDSGGTAPCHLALDRTGKMLIVANYGSGAVSAYPVKEDGSLGAMSSVMKAEGKGPNPSRQEGPHAHEVVISPDNKLAYVPDLGLDHIRLYQIDPATATLKPNDPAYIQQDPGMGPRHMAFSPDSQFVYVINELKSEVSVFTGDRGKGMKKIQDVSSLPASYSGENGPAEILLDASAKYVYATNRGADSVAVFAIEKQTGKLTQIQVISAEGKMPRGLEFDPSGKYLFVGNQKTNNFVIFHVGEDGTLKPTGQVVNTPSPVAFAFVPAE